MSTKDNGGPAFPTMLYEHNEGSDGMTLRDYFAAQAMQGDWAALNAGCDCDEAAARYYKMADAMMAARKK